ncbi:MAG TPA: hypothetical protein VFJ13_09630 [Paracoccaceae bacterium]|nr:hypothetical protein [Paracoccaceae bacterium]
MRRAGGALALALLLAACADERTDPLLPPDGKVPRAPAALPDAEPSLDMADERGPAPAVKSGPEPDAAADAPHIYMALQQDTAGPTSVILAIDRSRDNTPSDDPAIRLTPVDGQCNPQQLRRHEFPPERTRRPVYGPDQAASGVTARDLPEYMATAVTSEMLAAGLIDEPEESQPQNVCTRKLLQRMMIDVSAAG